MRSSIPINPTLQTLGRSATLAINEQSDALIKQGKKIYKLGLGQSPYPVPEALIAALRDNAFQKDYLNVQGLQSLCEAVAKFHQREDRLNIAPENVMIGPGSKELMYILMVVLDAEVLLPSPCWVSYLPQAKIANRKVSILPTEFEDQWALQAKVLDKYCEKNPKTQKLLILNYPNNPHGGNFSENDLIQLTQVARKHNVIILSDEIYGQIDFYGEHQSIAQYYPEGTIVSSGLSKWCGAGGWRLGTFAFPETLSPLLQSMAVVASETFTSVSAPIQHAAVTAFKKQGGIQEYLESSRQIMSELSLYAWEQFSAVDADVCKAKGGFYLFPGFSGIKEPLASAGIHDSTTLCSRLLNDTGVAILPGSAFLRDEQEMFVRLALVDFDGKAAIDAAQSKTVNRSFVEKYCPNVIEAVDGMVSWMKQFR